MPRKRPGPLVLKPSMLLRMARAKKITDHYPGGKVHCAKCGKWVGGDTESPSFWENGAYVRCPHCKKLTLAYPIYPTSKDFPTGLIVDVSGERTKYPLVGPEEAS